MSANPQRFDPYAILTALERRRVTYVLIGGFARVIQGTEELTLGLDFTPSTIHLHAGQPVTLHLANTSSGGHNFSAPQFFAASQITSGAGSIHDGTIEVPEGQTVSVQLTPGRGTFRLRCTHTLHTTFGMRGEIVVE